MKIILKCKRCLHAWKPRIFKKPNVCPRCKSPYWDTEKRVPKKDT